MTSSTHRTNFFSSLPGTEALLGNRITLREREGESLPGISQAFLASLVQFQPLAELNLLDREGRPVVWELTDKSLSPVEAVRNFRTPGWKLAQNTMIEGDQALLKISLTRDTGSGEEPVRAEWTGAGLFSPQGVPYHWDGEKNIRWKWLNARELEGVWQEERFLISFSEDLEDRGLKVLQDGDIDREHYFTSFNLKKRYTYRVRRENCRGGDPGKERSARNAGYSGIWRPRFDNRGEAVMTIRFRLVSSSRQEQAPEDYPGMKDRIRQDWEAFVKTVPSFECADPDLQRIYYTSWYILKAGRIRFPRERFAFPFTSVNKFHYYNQFFWDSAFQALAWLWSNDPEPAESEMKNFVLNQWRNGMIPYELFMYSVNGREWMDGDALTSNTTQPPVIGITVKEVFRKFAHTEYPAFFYEAFLKYDHWLTLYRDLGKRGLSCYVNIWETGWDNSPRLDASARNRVLDPYVEGVDFNVYIYLLRRTILDMARWLNRPEPAGIREKMEQTRASMNSLMFCPDDGFYYDLEAGSNRQIRVKTAAGLLPLLTDIPSPEQRERLVHQYLMNPEEFFTGTPVPSVSRSESSYDPRDFWRGANWPQITWSILYGIGDTHPREAGAILDRFLSTTAGNTNCYEYYHSETGEGAGLPFQGWGALYTDMVIRFMAGVVPEDEGFRVRPLPCRYGHWHLENIRIAGLCLAVTRNEDLWSLDFEGYGRVEWTGMPVLRVVFSAEELVLEFNEGEIGRPRLIPQGARVEPGRIFLRKSREPA